MTQNPEGSIHRVDPVELRRIFNEGGYLERARTGEYTQVVLWDRHPSLEKAFEPYCTKSQIVSYRDENGNEIVRVHQYLRPDQTIGASGKPDPKCLLEDGVLYRAVTPQD